jgi:hypothetical protein
MDNTDESKVLYLTDIFRQGARLRELLERYRVNMPAPVQRMFIRRPYSREELARAVFKYRIFGDLGLGD